MMWADTPGRVIVYDISGEKYALDVLRLCVLEKTRDVLEYGWDQGPLENALGFPIRKYDPSLPILHRRPKPADIVACINVLEHVEPERLEEILDDLRRVTRKMGYLVVGTVAGRYFLPNGGTAHQIQEGFHWWLPKLEARFRILEVSEQPTEFCVRVAPHSWRERLALLMSGLLVRVSGTR